MIDHLSYSAINHYLSCQRSYKHKYIDGIPVNQSEALAFGSAWHKMISLVVGSGTMTVNEAWSNPEIHKSFDWQSDMEYVNLANRMIESSREVIVRLTPYKAMIDHKVEFTIPQCPVPIIGYIDMIDHDKVPVDFKTAGRKWTQQAADDSLQPTFYLAGLHAQGFIKSSDFPYKFRYMVFTKTKKPEVQILETTRTSSDVLALFDLIGRCWDAIEQGIWLPSGIGSWKCSSNYCDFWDRCQAGKISDGK